MRRMVATKQFSYATRRLHPGDEFDARPRDARLLIAIKKAEEWRPRKVSRIPPPPPDLAQKIADTIAAPVPPVDADAMAADTLGAETMAADTVAAEAPVDHDPDMPTLRAEAEALGIKVDLRWGERRLRSEIDRAAG